jgi:hypothetical protein
MERHEEIGVMPAVFRIIAGHQLREFFSPDGYPVFRVQDDLHVLAVSVCPEHFLRGMDRFEEAPVNDNGNISA